MYKKYNKYNDVVNRNGLLKRKHKICKRDLNLSTVINQDGEKCHTDVAIDDINYESKHVHKEKHYHKHEQHRHRNNEKYSNKENIRENTHLPEKYHHKLRENIEKSSKDRKRSDRVEFFLEKEKISRKRHHSLRSTESISKSPTNKQTFHKTKTFSTETLHPLEITEKHKYIKHRSRSEKNSQDANKKISQIWYCQVETNSPFKQYRKDLDKIETEQKKRQNHRGALKERGTLTSRRHESVDKQLLEVLSPECQKSRTHHTPIPKIEHTQSKSPKKKKEKSNQVEKKSKHSKKSQDNPEETPSYQKEVDKKIEDGMKVYFSKLQELIDKKIDAFLHCKEDKKEDKAENDENENVEKEHKKHHHKRKHHNKNKDNKKEKHEASDKFRNIPANRIKEKTDYTEDNMIAKYNADFQNYLVSLYPKITHRKHHKHHRTHHYHPSRSQSYESSHASIISVDIKTKIRNQDSIEDTPSNQYFEHNYSANKQVDNEVSREKAHEKSHSRKKRNKSYGKEKIGQHNVFMSHECKDIVREVVKGNVINGPSTSVLYNRRENLDLNVCDDNSSKNVVPYRTEEDRKHRRQHSKEQENNFWVEGIEPAKMDKANKTRKRKMTPNLEFKTISIVGIPSQMKEKPFKGYYPEDLTVPVDEILEKKNRMKRFKLYYQYSLNNNQFVDSESGTPTERKSIASESFKIFSDYSEHNAQFYSLKEKPKPINVIKAPNSKKNPQPNELWQEIKKIPRTIKPDENQNIYPKENGDVLKCRQDHKHMHSANKKQIRENRKANKEQVKLNPMKCQSKVKKHEDFLTSKSDVDVSYSSLLFTNFKIQKNIKTNEEIGQNQQTTDAKSQDVTVNEFFNNIDRFKHAFEKQNCLTNVQVMQFLENMHRLYLAGQQNKTPNPPVKESLLQTVECSENVDAEPLKKINSHNFPNTLIDQLLQKPFMENQNPTISKAEANKTLQEISTNTARSGTCQTQSKNKLVSEDLHVNKSVEVCDKIQKSEITSTEELFKQFSWENRHFPANKSIEVNDYLENINTRTQEISCQPELVSDDSFDATPEIVKDKIEEAIFQIPTIRNRHLSSISDLELVNKEPKSKNYEKKKFTNASAAGLPNGETRGKKTATKANLKANVCTQANKMTINQSIQSEVKPEAKIDTGDKIQKKVLTGINKKTRLSTSPPKLTQPINNSKNPVPRSPITPPTKEDAEECPTATSNKTKQKDVKRTVLNKGGAVLTPKKIDGSTTNPSPLPTILENKDKPKPNCNPTSGANKKRSSSASPSFPRTKNQREENLLEGFVNNDNFKLKTSQSVVNFDKLAVDKEEGKVTSLVCLHAYQNDSKLTDSSRTNANSLDQYLLSNKSLSAENPHASRLLFTKAYRTSDVSSYQKRKKYDEVIRKKMKTKLRMQEKQLAQIFEVRYLSMCGGNTQNLLERIPESVESVDKLMEEKFKKITNKKYDKFLELIKKDVNAPYSNLFEYLSELPEAPVQSESHRHCFNMRNKCKHCDTGKHFMHFVNYLCNSLKSKCGSNKSNEEESLKFGFTPKSKKFNSKRRRIHKYFDDSNSSGNEENMFSINKESDKSKYVSCPVLKLSDSSFDFLYQEDSNDEAPAPKKRAASPILGFSLNENTTNKNTPHNQLYHESPPGSETSGYASSSRSKHSFSFLNFFKKPKMAALLKPQIEEAMFGMDVTSHDKMVQECRDFAQKVKEESKIKLDIIDEPYEEIPLDVLLSNTSSRSFVNCNNCTLNPRVCKSSTCNDVQNELALKRFASDTNLLTKEGNEPLVFITATEKDISTMMSVLPQCHIASSESKSSISSVDILFQKDSKQCISVMEKMLNSDISFVVTNLSSCSITLVESNESRGSFKSDENNKNRPFKDGTYSSSEIKRFITKKFFENILEMYEKEASISSALLEDEEFIESQLLACVNEKTKSSIKKKRTLGSKIKAAANIIFNRKPKRVEEVSPTSIEKSEPVENEYQVKLQALAHGAHKYFSMLVQAVTLNNKMEDEMKMYGILRLLEAIGKGRFTFLRKFIIPSQHQANLEMEIRNQVKQTFIDVYSSAKCEAQKCRRKLNNNDVQLMSAFVCKYRIGLLSQTDIVASYLGKGFFENESQLKAAVTYLLKSTNDVDLDAFEEFCQNHLTC